jgi:Protein of unknown function (DUF732)
MFSGVARHACVLVTTTAVLTGAALLPGVTATADPGQDQKFFDLLGEKDIPPVDNANSLIETAHKACSKLDGGMSVGDLVDLIRNNGYNENPLTRLNPPDRITRTINQFIIASVQAYCPYDAGKIASIAAYNGPGVATDNPDGRNRSHVVVLASVTEALPAGEIPPTKPLPAPAQPPPPPEELAPAPQQPPPPPRHVQQAPQRQQQVEPPPQEPPPPAEQPPQVEQPQAPAPAPEPGGGNGGAPAPDSPSPAPPAPPGHIRLAP